MADDMLFGELDSMSRRLEPMMTKLAKACLTNKPDDLDTFCYNFFASRLGIAPQVQVLGARAPSTTVVDCKTTEPTRGIAADDDLDEASEEEEADYTAAIIRAKSRRNIVRKTNYDSSDDDAAGASSSPVPTAAEPEPPYVVSYCRAESDFVDDEDEMDAGEVRKLEGSGLGFPVKSRSMKEVIDFGHQADILSPAEYKRIEKLTRTTLGDPRVKQLFCCWDTDGGGTVDLMELVVALHKFVRVMEDGSDLKRATEALARKDTEGNNHELNLAEFTWFVVQFCDDAYGKTFDEMAAHMLAVAASSSERAAIAESRGYDVDSIMKEDEDEIELLKETVRGAKSTVEEKIDQLQTKRRVMFQ